MTTALHKADIKGKLKRFLERKSTPRFFEAKPAAADAETDALVDVIASLAPRDADRLRDWWPGFERECGLLCGHLWPSEKDCAKAAKAAPVASLGSGTEWVLDPPVINAKRMAEGKAVGEAWLYGSLSVEMIARGLVDEATMRRYRSSAYFARKNIYGEEAAKAWEDEAIARHDSARRQHREVAEGKDVPKALPKQIDEVVE